MVMAVRPNYSHNQKIQHFREFFYCIIGLKDGAMQSGDGASLWDIYIDIHVLYEFSCLYVFVYILKPPNILL